MLDLSADAAMFGGDFGETVVYHPQGRPARTLERINVEREGLGAVAGGDGVGPSFVISVPNDPDIGVTRSELDRGRDHFELPVRVGGETTRRRVVAVGEEDDGMLTLFLE